MYTHVLKYANNSLSSSVVTITLSLPFPSVTVVANTCTVYVVYLSNISMTAVVLVVLLSSVREVPFSLVYSTRYDLIMPLLVIGGIQMTKIDVELTIRAATFNGALGAEE